MRTIHLIVPLLLAGLLWGCGPHEPPPLMQPVVQPAVSHYVGTPLSGPQPGDVKPADLAGSWVVTVSFLGLEQLPPIGATEPLDKDQRIKLILDTREGHPIVATGRLMQTVRIVPDAGKFLADLGAGQYGRMVPIRTLQGALPESATVTLGISDPSSALAPLAEPTWIKTIQLEFGRLPGMPAYDAAVLVADLQGEAEPPTKTTDDQPMPGNNYNIKPPPVTTPPVYQRELALFNPPPSPTYALLVPMKFSSSTIQGVLAVVTIATAPPPGMRDQANQEALKDLRVSKDETVNNVVVLDPPEWPGLSAAVAALAQPARQRQALSYMASSAGATVCADVVLSADANGLAAIARNVAKDLSDATAITPPPGRKYLGWVIEKGCLRTLAAMQSASTLSAELAAALAVDCGQAGRDASTFSDVIAGSKGEQDFQNRLATANFAYLEDSSKTARVRAFDWLNWRHDAPPGYDPTAKLADCRAALRKFQDESSTQLTTQPTNP